MRLFAPAIGSLLMTIALVLGPGNAAACGNGKLILEDRFETLEPAWGFAKENRDRSNGPDGVVYKLDPGGWTFVLNQSGFYDEYEVCAVFATRLPTDDADAYVGVAFWANDRDNFYEADVYPAWGTYKIIRSQNGKYLEPVAITSNDAIRKGTDVTNEISVAVKGNKATLTINGRKILDFTGRPPEGGSLFGFGMSTRKTDKGPSTLRVRSIQLRELEAQPKRG